MRASYPDEHGKARDLHPNAMLTHPLARRAKAADRSRWQYTFLRVTRWPTPDRPDSGRVMVQNQRTGERGEYYALLFDVKFAECP